MSVVEEGDGEKTRTVLRGQVSGRREGVARR